MHISRSLLVLNLLAAATVGLAPPSLHAFSFEEAEKLDRVESTELLARARKAAEGGDTAGARRFVAQARAKGAAPAQIKAVETVVAQAEERAEQARRAEESRRQADAAAAAANRANGGGGGSGARGDGANYVLVETSCITGAACFVSNLQVSGQPGQFEPSFRAAGSGSIRKGSSSGSLAGQYSYSYVIELASRRCTAAGSFTLDGSKGNVKIGHYPDCRLSSVHTY
jgi:hypothetical protein